MNGQMSLRHNQHPPPPVPHKVTNGDNSYGSLPPSVSQTGIPYTPSFQSPVSMQQQAPRSNQTYDPSLWTIKTQYEEQEQVMSFVDDTFDDLSPEPKEDYIEARSQNGVHNYENAPPVGGKNNSREYMNTFDNYSNRGWDGGLGY